MKVQSEHHSLTVQYADAQTAEEQLGWISVRPVFLSHTLSECRHHWP